MRKAALQMMDYLQEWVAKLSAAYLEEAERNGYAWDAHIVPRAARRFPLAARQPRRGQAHTEVKRTEVKAHRGLDSHERAAATRRPPALTHAHQLDRERRGHMRAGRAARAAQLISCGRVMAKKELTLVSSTATRRRGRVTSSREVVGDGADLKANEV